MAEILFSISALSVLGFEDAAEGALTALASEIESYAAEIGCVGFASLGRGKNAGAIVCAHFEEVLLNGFLGCDEIAVEDDRGSLEIHATRDGRHLCSRVRFLTREGYDHLLDVRGYAFCVTKRKLVEEVFSDRRLSRKPYFALARKGVA